MSRNTNENVQLGVPLSPDEVEQLTTLRAEFKPELSRKRVEEFAKWLFPTVAVVGTLGAGFNNASFQNLGSYGQWALAIAVILSGASLAFATIGYAPKKASIVPDSMESMRAVLSDQLARRLRFIQIATITFAIALGVAALAPILSTIPSKKEAPPEPKWESVTYSIDANGKLAVELDMGGLTPHSAFELGLVTEPSSRKQLLPYLRSAADTSGKGKVKIELTDVRKIKGRLFAVSRWGPNTEEKDSAAFLHTRRLEIPLSQK